MELTKEYFDKQLGKLVTKEYFELHLEEKLEEKLEPIREDIRYIKADLSNVKDTVERIDKRDLEASDVFRRTAVNHDED